MFFLILKKTFTNFFSTMVSNQKYNFQGKIDRFNGVLINSLSEPCNETDFHDRLQASLNQWLNDKRRAIWFQVDLSHTHWVPILTSQGFKFHHAKENEVVLYRWLPIEEVCNIPPYAHTNIGVGALVFNKDKEEIVVVKEKHGINDNWKLPGGYVEPGENFDKAVEREVLEETGITAKFKCMIGFRHTHKVAFGCSDIYIISYLIPETFDIKQNSSEIVQCQWMKLEDYVTNPNVHENNRMVGMKFRETLNLGIGLNMIQDIHPITKKPITIYSIGKIE